MFELKTLIKEQFSNLGIVYRISKYEDRATYQSHYLGLAWEILNPLIQVGIYYLVFGVVLNGGRTTNGIPFFIWMIIGITPWFFMNTSVTGMSNSIYRQVGLVAKMKFPVSVLPTINMFSNLTAFYVMFGFTLFATLFNHIMPTIYWLQFIYYFIAMICFLFAFGIFNSTITVLVRDYHITLQSIMRVLFYMSGVLWNIESKNLSTTFVQILKLNPFYYIVSGFRKSLLGQGWFYQEPTLTLFFWGVVLLLLIVGSHLHYKFRARFVDLI